LKAELFNVTGQQGRDCPRCFRTGTLAGPRTERAQMECSGCFGRFQLERGPGGELDTLRRIFFTLPDASTASIVTWPLAMLVLVAFLLGGCAGPEPIRGAGDEVAPPAGWTEYCARHPDDAGCRT
jgi:hypothetical protein